MVGGNVHVPYVAGVAVGLVGWVGWGSLRCRGTVGTARIMAPKELVQMIAVVNGSGFAKGRALITVTAGAGGPLGGDRLTSFSAIAKHFVAKFALIQLQRSVVRWVVFAFVSRKLKR